MQVEVQHSSFCRAHVGAGCSCGGAAAARSVIPKVETATVAWGQRFKAFLERNGVTLSARPDAPSISLAVEFSGLSCTVVVRSAEPYVGVALPPPGGRTYEAAAAVFARDAIMQQYRMTALQAEQFDTIVELAVTIRSFLHEDPRPHVAL